MPVTTVTATAAAITAALSAAGGPGSTYRAIATTCSSVFSLPPRLAAITPWRMTQNRSKVTATSLAMITAVTHQASSPRAESVTSAAPGEPAIQQIRHGGHAEHHERRHPPLRPAGQQARDEDLHQNQAQHRQR